MPCFNRLIERPTVLLAGFIVLSTYGLNSCRTTNNAAVLEATHEEPEDDTFTSDLPKNGRSLFDQVFASAGSTAIFPFENLLKHLKDAHQAKPGAVLIPHGRSLQKNATDAQSPRIVTATEVAFKSSGCATLPQNQILIGYAEKAESLEVISYNERDGRFEFQVVKDYAEGKQPKVFYAKRSLCTSCHQQGRPIFSRRQWSESNIHFFQLNDANAVVDEIKAAHPGESLYHGVQIDPDATINNPLSALSADQIDRSVVNMNIGVTLSEMWKRGCGAGEERTECRGLVLRFALAALPPTISPSNVRGELGIDPTSPQYLRLRELWHANWPTGGIAVPEVLIANREPGATIELADDADPLFERSPAHIIKADDVSAEDFVPVDFSFPQFLRFMKDRPTPNRMILHLRDLWLRPFEATLVPKLATDPSLIDQVVSAPAVRAALASDTAPSLTLVNEVFRALDLPAIDSACFQSSAMLPDPQTLNGTSEALDEADGKTAIIGLFKEFCSACHQDSGEDNMDFLIDGTTDAQWTKLKSRSDDIVRRLRWESASLAQSERMPASGPLRKKLMKPERSADRFKMISALLAD